MTNTTKRWALVLAAGAGTRLNSLTRFSRSGTAIPKQFCSLTGGASLLEETLARAFAVTTPARTIVVVAAEHEEFWADGTLDVPADNLIVQPSNRGTAFGILLGVAAVLARDPEAALLLLPSDHYVAHEGVLRQSIVNAFVGLGLESRTVRFLGIEPESADPELGYIVRGPLVADASYRIERFVEKPRHAEAQDLLARSALWNSFILIGRARAFVELIGSRYPVETQAMLRAVAKPTRAASGTETLERLYARLPIIDFSRDIVQQTEVPLEVVPVGACGWSDLGTPRRVAECLTRVNGSRPARPTTHLSLAEAQMRCAQLTA